MPHYQHARLLKELFKLFWDRSGKDYALSYSNYWLEEVRRLGINSKIQSLNGSARSFRNFQNYRTRVLFFFRKLALSP